MENKKKILIEDIPALVWGPCSDKVYIYVHGRMGNKEEAAQFADIAAKKGYQVISFDLPEHGERKEADYPLLVWNAVHDLQVIHNYAVSRWEEINLYACSIGAYFSLMSYSDMNIKKTLFQCPILNMEKLIADMMVWFQVSEERLKAEKRIATPMGETLDWDYLDYVRKHPIKKWESDTHILYPSKDMLTGRDVIDEFVNNYSAHLAILEGAEHYYTEPLYLTQTNNWLSANI